MYTAQNYFDAGVAAERAGDIEAAHIYYYRAYMNTVWGNADSQKKALAMYNLGRMKGYLCKKSEAEELLVKSADIEATSSRQNSEWYTGRLVELARFHFDFKEYSRAVLYYEIATSRLVASDNEATSPIEMAEIWDDYAQALRELGRHEESLTVAMRANQLRTDNPGKVARFIPVRYNQNCASGG